MRIASKRTFTHDVTVFTPIDGGHRKEVLKTTFNYLDVHQADAFDLSARAGISEFLLAIVNKFDGLIDDASGQPTPYNEELRDQLLSLPHVRMALVTEYFGAVQKAKAGN